MASTGAPICLYIDLEDGRKADLEIVARAAEAFVEAIREVAFVLDPSLEIRIELIDGTEASLSLNSIIRAVKGGDVKDLTLRAVVVAVIWWFTQHGLDYAYEKVMDKITGQPEQTVHLSDADKHEIADMVAKAIKGKVAQPQVQRVYRELESDSAVRGVGATSVRGSKPRDIVPREQFPIVAGYTIEVQAPTKRRRVMIERLVIVSPVLKHAKRRWKFAFREGEFGASIQDDASRDMLLNGSIPMREGIEVDAELETIEELRGTVWVPTERNVLKIVRIHRPMVQASLDLPRTPNKNKRKHKK